MLRVTGGEPTISPVFSGILELCDGLGKPIVVFSNGLWSDVDSVIAALRRCRNLDGVLVSLHGHTEASYRAFTGGTHFSTVLENIRRATEAGITVNTNTILTAANIDHMPEVVDLATAAGAQVVAFSRHYGVPISGLTDLSPDHYQFAIHQVERLRTQGKRVKFNNNIPLCLGGHHTQACPAGDTHCTVSSTSKVRICNHSPLELGDLLTTPIQEIWQGEPIQAWRRQVPAICHACAAFESCRGGCRATAMANRLDADPLACRTCRTPPSWPIIHHALPASSIPIADFAIHPESFGYVLINRSQILKVSKAADRLLDVLQDGSRSLVEIGATFGRPSLNLIGLLYEARMVELRRPGEHPREVL